MKKITLLVGLVSLLFTACKKSDSTSTPSTPIDSVKQAFISGVVQLPAGATVATNTLTIQSAIATAAVVDSKFSIETFTSQYSTQLVLNGNQEVVMLGYSYPGQIVSDISATTTALALVMNTRAILFLSAKGKKDLVPKVLACAPFTSLVQAVEASIVANHNLFDTTNQVLLQCLSNVFATATLRPMQVEGASDPVIINRAGKMISFTNNTNSFTTVVGIYKNGARLEQFVVEGLQMYPNSVSEVFNGYGGTSADPKVFEYTFPSDGNYEIKIRTGLPGAGDNSAEHNEAFYQNLGLFCNNLLGILLPTLKLNPELSTNLCNKKIFLTNTINLVMSSKEIYDSKSVFAATYAASSLILQNVDFILKDCQKKQVNSFFGAMAGLFNVVDKAFGFAGATANATVFATQWGYSKSMVDTCFNVEGNTVSACMDTFAILRSKNWTLSPASLIKKVYNHGALTTCKTNTMEHWVTTLTSGALSFSLLNGKTLVTESKGADRKISVFTDANTCQTKITYEKVSESFGGLVSFYDNSLVFMYDAPPGVDPTAGGGSIPHLMMDCTLVSISKKQLVLSSPDWGQLIFN